VFGYGARTNNASPNQDERDAPDHHKHHLLSIPLDIWRIRMKLHNIALVPPREGGGSIRTQLKTLLDFANIRLTANEQAL
jgi:hypothetical protein